VRNKCPEVLALHLKERPPTASALGFAQPWLDRLRVVMAQDRAAQVTFPSDLPVAMELMEGGSGKASRLVTADDRSAAIRFFILARLLGP
jgi:hypothetical protein